MRSSLLFAWVLIVWSAAACDGSRGRAGPSHGPSDSGAGDTSTIALDSSVDGAAPTDAGESDPADASGPEEGGALADVGAEPDAADPAGSDAAGTEPDGADPAGSDAAGTEPDGADPAGSDAAGSDASALDGGSGVDAGSLSDAGICTLAPRTQAFGAVDVLFVLDTSCSMGPALDDLVARAQTFIQNLVLARLQNFHIGVTTMDVGPGAAAGRLVTPMITGGSADPAHDLSTALDVGNTGSSSAQGLEAARLALDPATNPGFLRADAGLLVIFVADDEDTSPGLAASYVSPIVGTHDPYNAAVNTIIGDVPGGCSAPLLGITAAAGTRYDFLRALLSGSFSSICAASPLAALSHFGPPQLGLARALQLSAPYPSQIIGIEVGGQRLSGFTYDAPSGVIHFAPDQVPAGGSVLSIQVPCP